MIESKQALERQILELVSRVSEKDAKLATADAALGEAEHLIKLYQNEHQSLRDTINRLQGQAFLWMEIFKKRKKKLVGNGKLEQKLTETKDELALSDKKIADLETDHGMLEIFPCSEYMKTHAKQKENWQRSSM